MLFKLASLICKDDLKHPNQGKPASNVSHLLICSSSSQVLTTVTENSYISPYIYHWVDDVKQAFHKKFNKSLSPSVHPSHPLNWTSPTAELDKAAGMCPSPSGASGWSPVETPSLTGHTFLLCRHQCMFPWATRVAWAVKPGGGKTGSWRNYSHNCKDTRSATDVPTKYSWVTAM